MFKRILNCFCCCLRPRREQLEEGSQDIPITSVDIQDPTEKIKLTSPIARGSFGQVFKGQHLETHEELAIKIIKTLNKDNEDEISNEINILQKASRHNNIVSFYGVYQQPDSIQKPIWIAMEFCGGGSVYELLNQACGRSLPEGCIAYICREVLQGLIYLHKNGIAHRDIKAANIALTEDAEVRIIDFGLAVELKWYQSSTQLAGTPNYTAPEVWTGARYKFECDIWSLGITAIEMADGDPPLSQLAAGTCIPLNDPPTFKRPDIWSEAFNSFLKLCLTKKQRDRPKAKALIQHPFVKDLQNEAEAKEELRALIRRANTIRACEKKFYKPKEEPQISEKRTSGSQNVEGKHKGKGNIEENIGKDNIEEKEKIGENSGKEKIGENSGKEKIGENSGKDNIEEKIG